MIPPDIDAQEGKGGFNFPYNDKRYPRQRRRRKCQMDTGTVLIVIPSLKRNK
jgi:hypothetical protein